jgi:hypothetical protein
MLSTAVASALAGAVQQARAAGTCASGCYAALGRAGLPAKPHATSANARRFGAVASSASNMLPPGLDALSADGLTNLASMRKLLSRLNQDLAKVGDVMFAGVGG